MMATEMAGIRRRTLGSLVGPVIARRCGNDNAPLVLAEDDQLDREPPAAGGAVGEALQAVTRGMRRAGVEAVSIVRNRKNDAAVIGEIDLDRVAGVLRRIRHQFFGEQQHAMRRLRVEPDGAENGGGVRDGDRQPRCSGSRAG